DIQRPAGEFLLAATAPVRCLDITQHLRQRADRHVSMDFRHKVVERGAIKTDRLTFIHRAQAHLAELCRQRIQPAANIGVAVNVGAKTEKHLLRHGRSPRSMMMPTSCEPRSAPGLDRRRRSHGTENSVSTISATFSASVSTSWYSAAWIKAIRRLP